MYCLTCNLDYPENLNFCKQCGRPLAASDVGAEPGNPRCTRCGARVVKGENFCQMCGARLAAQASDTTIGTCHNCGALWRSTWLFCKNCGVARDHALVASMSSPPAPSIMPTVTATAYDPEREMLEAAQAPRCPYCAAEVVPNSHFCEACGGKLREATTGDLTPPPGLEPPAPIVAQAIVAEKALPDAPQVEPAAAPAAAASAAPAAPASSSSPAVIESQPEFSAPSVLPEMARPASAARAAGVTAPASSRGAMTEEGEASQLDPFARTGEVEEVKVLRDRAGNRVGVAAPVATKVTQIPASSPRVVLAPPTTPLRRTYSTGQKIGLASIALLLVAVMTGWLLIQRTRTESPVSSPQKAGVAQPSVQPTPAITPQTAPSPQSNASLAPPPGMVYVSGGTFQMGRNDGEDWERPAHMVTVAPFFIDLTEVTNEQYQEFVNQTDHRPPPYWKDGRYPEGTGRLPVVNVSWPDAKAYAEWAGKRLPAEEEWELAARGTSGRLYPWGSEWNAALANTKENNRSSVMEVGRFAAGASPFGALDMCGNVWEWTASDALSYLIKGRVIADGKVIRGGAFNVPRDKATATYRGVAQSEKNTYDKIGFRCARDVNK